MNPPPGSRPCPLCGSARVEDRLRKGELRLVRCLGCSLVYADPLPSESSPEHYDRLGNPFYLSPDKLESDYASVRFERELRLFRRHCRRGDVLDVGCSTGAFLYQLGRRYPGDYRSTGIEVSTAALDHARSRGVDVVADSLTTHDFGERRFDAVTFWAVIEHLPEPAAFLRRAFDLLRPGGVVVVLVPNFESLAVRVLGARYRYILPQHVNYFSSATLARLLAVRGGTVVDRGGSHFNPAVIWQDYRRGGDATVPDAKRAALLRRTTRLKQSPWLRPAKWALAGFESVLASAGLADNIWAVARKDAS
ncbi:MAG: class I SAM-dependent methyltransferase [Verrucomicrobiales bacterium]|nr:class I SAM-dependent methyltransferase [Verrucomicrobiales bacterium]